MNEKLANAVKELEAARAEEIEASNAYAGDDLTEDWHRAALARLMRAEDAVKRLEAEGDGTGIAEGDEEPVEETP